MSQPAPVDIPHHTQETDYTCGPAALKMVLDALWGIRVEEASLAERMGTDAHVGTRQKVLAGFVGTLGLQASVRHTDTMVQEIRDHMAAGHVVVVCYWLDGEDTDHYAVVQHIDDQVITLQDPWVGPEVHMDLQVFEADWRSDPNDPKHRDRWMLAIKVPGA